jgi:hypothetical protein
MGPLPLSSLPVPLSIALALWQWGRIPRPRGRVFGLLGALIALALATEVAALVLRCMHHGNTTLYNGFAVAEMVLGLALVRALRPAWTARLLVVAVTGLAIFAADWAMRDRTGFMLTEGIVGIAVLLCGCCLAVLWDLAQVSSRALQRVPEFWLFMGLLVYFGGIPPMIGMMRYLYSGDPETARRFYAVIPALCVVRYLLTALACGMVARARRRYAQA